MIGLRFLGLIEVLLLLGCTIEKSPDPAARSLLPLLAEGATLEPGAGKDSCRRTFRLGAPGVYYVWLRVGPVRDKVVLAYDLDGLQPLKSDRGEISIEPNPASRWVCATRLEGFKAEVHAAAPGDHALGIRLREGTVTVEKVALTLFHSAEPAGEALDHSKDPGGGRADFAVSSLEVDGFRESRRSPPIQAARTFYVDSESGDDQARGESPARAWKSIKKVNSQAFEPGDAILLKRGGRWEEGLHPAGNGTPEKWITLGAYGGGPRPRIDGKDQDAVRLASQSYWVVQDLELTSDPRKKRAGLEALTSEGNPRPKGIRLCNLVAFDNGGDGIHVGSEKEKGNGYDGVEIENCLSFCNGSDGIAVNGSDQNGCRNSVIRYCTAYSNPGMAGIWIHSGQNGLIEHCRAYNNACINIWTWNSINVTIRFCEAFRGRPRRDAGGFDIDWGCEACTIEHCYSHHNEGPGFLIMGAGIEKYRGFPMQSRYNLLRYCVSEEDGEPISMLETFDHGKVYNNLALARGEGKTALKVGGFPLKPGWAGEGGWPSQNEIVNNILIGMEGATPLWVDDHAAHQGNVLDHNLYFKYGSQAPLARWAGRENGPGFWDGAKEGTYPPDDYPTLEHFRKATRQEARGIEADPMVKAPGRGGYGRLPLDAYVIPGNSSAAGAGRRVELGPEWLAGRARYLTDTGAGLLGIPMDPSPVTEDYRGHKLDSQAGGSIGPFQITK